MSRSAIVVGGGIAGLSAGIALRKAGYHVTLFEAAPKLAPIGAALSIWGSAMAGLDWLGCGDVVRERAAPMLKLRLMSVNDRPIWGPVDIAQSDSWMTMRSDLQAALLARLGEEHCRLGVRIDGLRERGSKVVAFAGSEQVAEADLAIAADGIRSPIGTLLIGNEPTFRGYVGVLGIGPTSNEKRVGMAEEIWAERDRFGLFDAGDGRRYWFYLASAQCPHEAESLDHAEVIRRGARFPERVGAAVAATDPASLIALAIHSRAMPRRMGRGRVICIGDAAHGIKPNQGQGGCQGIEDAWALGLLARRLSPDRIVDELEHLRFRRIRKAMFDSAIVGRAAHSPHPMRDFARWAIRLPPIGFARKQFFKGITPAAYE